MLSKICISILSTLNFHYIITFPSGGKTKPPWSSFVAYFFWYLKQLTAKVINQKIFGQGWGLMFSTFSDIRCEGENIEFNWCASKCPTTCQSPCRNMTVCAQSCEKRCDCKSGFILDETSLKCVEPSKCPSCSELL